MLPALVIGMLVGVALGAVLVDVLFVQPLNRDYNALLRTTRRWQRNAENWEALASVRHPGTPYIRSYQDNWDHSKAAELRVVR